MVKLHRSWVFKQVPPARPAVLCTDAQVALRDDVAVHKGPRVVALARVQACHVGARHDCEAEQAHEGVEGAIEGLGACGRGMGKAGVATRG